MLVLWSSIRITLLGNEWLRWGILSCQPENDSWKKCSEMSPLGKNNVRTNNSRIVTPHGELTLLIIEMYPLGKSRKSLCTLFQQRKLSAMSVILSVIFCHFDCNWLSLTVINCNLNHASLNWPLSSLNLSSGPSCNQILGLLCKFSSRTKMVICQIGL